MRGVVDRSANAGPEQWSRAFSYKAFDIGQCFPVFRAFVPDRPTSSRIPFFKTVTLQAYVAYHTIHISFVQEFNVSLFSFVDALPAALLYLSRKTDMLRLLLLALFFFHTAQSLYVAGPADPDDDHFYHFVTRPDIGAPKWSIEIYDKDALAPGYWFVAPYALLGQTDYPLWNGPHIYDQEGGLIWSGSPLFKHFNSYDFRVAQVRYA